MRLFIAEKPSLGKAIAMQLPGQKKAARTHIQCGADVVTWAFGHLYELLVAALPPALTDPGVTGLWEDFLSEIAAGNRTLDEFEMQQRAFVVKRVEAAKAGAALAMPAHSAPATTTKTKPKTTKKRRVK